MAGFAILDAFGNRKTTLLQPQTAIISNTDTGTQNNWTPGLTASESVIEWSGGSDITVNGFAAGSIGQRWRFKNTGTHVGYFANQSGSATGKKLSNVVTSGTTPVAAGGFIEFIYDGTNWVLIAHEQGIWINIPYNGANFAGLAPMTWTVDAGDQSAFAYKLQGNTLYLSFYLQTTTVGGTPGRFLEITIPNSFTLVSVFEVEGARIIDNNASPAVVGSVSGSAAGTVVFVARLDGNNLSASTNLTYVIGAAFFQVN